MVHRTATTRPAALAGHFYPADPAVLRTTVASFLTEANRPGQPLPKAVIVPHAGYIYSGAVAAKAYERLKAADGLIRRVVLLGPTHRVYVHGLAAPKADHFATPLGEITIDQAALE